MAHFPIPHHRRRFLFTRVLVYKYICVHESRPRANIQGDGAEILARLMCSGGNFRTSLLYVYKYILRAFHIIRGSRIQGRSFFFSFLDCQLCVRLKCIVCGIYLSIMSKERTTFGIFILDEYI